MKIIFFGDVVGRPGREAIKKIMPELKKEYQPDLVVANVENIAHGKGITKKSLEEILESGVDLATSGDHTFSQKETTEILENENSSLLRPANYPPGVPGKGYKIIEIGARTILVMNLMGRVFFNATLDCPFRKADEILEEAGDGIDAIIIDFHCEATSEKKAFGYYLDGRAAAVLGTHTHIPTADEQILPKGTAYISDVGMAGPKNSILGTKIETSLNHFLTQKPFKYDLAFSKDENNEVEVNAVLIEIDPNSGKAKKIGRIRREIVIS